MEFSLLKDSVYEWISPTPKTNDEGRITDHGFMQFPDLNLTEIPDICIRRVTALAIENTIC
jgi:hypothetical protein